MVLNTQAARNGHYCPARERAGGRQNLRMFRPLGRLIRMQLGIALTPIVWLVVIGVVVLGGVVVRSAGARG